MQKIINGIKRDLQNRPGKTLLTLLSVALGVAVLIIALSISSYLKNTLLDQMNQQGVVLNLVNGEKSEESGVSTERPSQLDGTQLDLLETELEILASPLVTEMIFSNILVDSQSYQIRRVVGSDENYSEIMGLSVIAGLPLSQDDVDQGRKVALISQSLAEELFGNAEAAIGQTFSPPRMEFRGRDGENRSIVETYKIQGVFEDPPALLSRSYGIADLVIPYTSMLPQGGNSRFMMGMLSSSMVVSVKDMNAQQAEAMIRDVLTREFGDDLKLYLWEGTPEGDTSLLDQARSTVSTFTIVVSLLGFFLLLTGSMGILSIMMVEALGRTREIALERALGASKQVVLLEYFLKSLGFSGIAAALGVILAFATIGPFSGILTPVTFSLGLENLPNPHVLFLPLLIGVLSSLFVGGVLGALPVLTVMNQPLAETIGEV